ncbi:MAG: acyl-CoA thioester hydrolase [Desulfobacterales bacterium]|nr:MAG: acyl-CoA thioester hydrolase [Desulfobacterales bacterium]
MKPKPFCPALLNAEINTDSGIFVRDLTDGRVWHRCAYRTLYADTDRSDVVYHANYLRYFEVGRSAIMRDLSCPYREIEDDDFRHPIIRTELEYFSPLRYDDPLWIYTRPGRLERVKLQFDYLITHGETGEVVCRGYTRHCAIRANGTPVAVDEKTLRIWERFPEDAAG